MNTPAPSRAARSEAADYVTVILFAAASAIGVAGATVLRLFEMFRPDGFAWTLRLDEMPLAAASDAGLPTAGIYVDQVVVVSPDVNVVSMTSGAASAIIVGIAALVGISAVAFVALSFLRGRFFVRSTARAFDVIGWAVLIGGLAAMSLDTMARNGVLAAIGDESAPIHPVEFWSFAPVWAIAIAIGLLSRAFRRGIRLEHDTAGLV